MVMMAVVSFQEEMGKVEEDEEEVGKVEEEEEEEVGKVDNWNGRNPLNIHPFTHASGPTFSVQGFTIFVQNLFKHFKDNHSKALWSAWP